MLLTSKHIGKIFGVLASIRHIKDTAYSAFLLLLKNLIMIF